jgi:hypothetical protein
MHAPALPDASAGHVVVATAGAHDGMCACEGCACGAESHAWMQDKVMSLREQLAEERQVLYSREKEKAMLVARIENLELVEKEKAVLEARIDRLTHIVLNSTRAFLATPPLHSPSPPPAPGESSASGCLLTASVATNHPLAAACRSFKGSDADVASVKRERSATCLVRAAPALLHAATCLLLPAAVLQPSRRDLLHGAAALHLAMLPCDRTAVHAHTSLLELLSARPLHAARPLLPHHAAACAGAVRGRAACRHCAVNL